MNKINDRYIKIDSMQHFCRVMDLGEEVVFLEGGGFSPVNDELTFSKLKLLVEDGRYYHDTKPKKQVVDMEPFIRNGLDCEFYDKGDPNGFRQYGTLTAINHLGFFDHDNQVSQCCKPRLNNVFIWEGQDLPEGLIVEYGIGWGTGDVTWGNETVHRGNQACVARITGVKDGYCFPGCES